MKQGFLNWISGSSGQYSLRNTHTPTHTPVFPVVQRGHTPTLSHSRGSLWCREECTCAHTHTHTHTHPAVLPMVQRQNLGGQGTRTRGVLQHQGKHTQGRRGQPQAPSGLRGVCVSTCQRRKISPSPGHSEWYCLCRGDKKLNFQLFLSL